MEEKLLPNSANPQAFSSARVILAVVCCDALHLRYGPGIFDPVSCGKTSELGTLFLPMLDVEYLDLCRLPSLFLAQKEKKKKNALLSSEGGCQIKLSTGEWQWNQSKQ